MTSIELYCQEKLKIAKDNHLLRSLKNFIFLKKNYIEFKNTKYLSFASSDYLGLKTHSSIKKSAIKAIKKYGIGSGSSRLITGNYDDYLKLETKISKFYNREKSVIFGSGYLTALGVITALIEKEDLIIGDKFIHNSLITGSQLSNAELKRFTHNDLTHLEKIITAEKQKNPQRKILIISESVFSMDGDHSNIQALIDIAKENNCWLLIDYAHSIYIKEKIENYKNLIIIGTLSKAIGSYGGYVTASKNICDHIINSARTLIYSTSLPTPVIAAANTAFKIIEKNKQQKTLINNIKYFSQLSSLKSESSIFIIKFNDIEKMLNMHKYLMNNKIYCSAIRPPTAQTPRLRITINSNHSKKELKLLAFLINNYLQI